jgi:dipeptidyl aminopeptidase/acylaminoacyl peptidase
LKARHALLTFFLVAPLVAPATIAQQVTVADYARAEQFLPWNATKLVLNADVAPHWIAKTTRFYYVQQMPNEAKHFVLVDAATGKSSPAFDHDRLAGTLSQAAGKTFAGDKLPFESFTFSQDEKTIEFDVAADHWVCNLSGNTCEKKGAAEKPVPSQVLSPDKKWAAFLKDHNLYVKSVASGEEIQLTTDGQAHLDYASQTEANTSAVSNKLLAKKDPRAMAAQAPVVLWSPDSKRIATYQLDERKVKESYVLQSVPPVGQRPILYTFHFPMPGDPDIGMAKMMVFDVAQRKRVDLEMPLQPVTYGTPFDFKLVSWDKPGRQIFVLQMDRYWKNPKLTVSDAETGATRTMLEEHVSTQFDIATNLGSGPTMHILGDGAEVIWYSERDGWAQLYLYDGKTGALKNRITNGAWPVGSIPYVDEANRWAYFTASGKEAGENPYLEHLYRVKLDGTSLQLLTPEPAQHGVSFSPDNRYFVDTYSRPDFAPITVLRSADGKVIREIERADISALKAKGWDFPEPFRAKADDGSTDVYGLIYKPSNFDPSKKYPVIDSPYPGPQINRVPATLPGVLGDFNYTQSTAELGFVMVVMDGRGTPGRSKAFHDASYGKLGDAGGLQDHVSAIREIAASRPYMDLTRVGIYGHSGGGFQSARAILAFPDFYKVAVASAGNHDQRGYLALWGEKYEGPVQGDNYLEQANPRLAANLKGKLLLMYGDMDDNVPGALTLQLIDALIKANKDFDLLVLPNRNHGGAADPYFIRRRWDYFVQNLLGATPPPYKIESSMPGYMTVEVAPEKN